MKTDYTKLFEFLTSAVFADGGDGDGWVYCTQTNVDEMADSFEEYLKTMGYDWIKPLVWEESPGTRAFSDMSNENFVFTSNMNQRCPDWVTVKIIW